MQYLLCTHYTPTYLLFIMFINFITRIRLKTWQRLKSIKGGTFTNILQSMLDIHETLSLLTLPHYHALERRLKIIYATVVMCQRKSDKSILK
jgi:glycosaminoglycan xylosylkinase